MVALELRNFIIALDGAEQLVRGSRLVAEPTSYDEDPAAAIRRPPLLWNPNAINQLTAYFANTSIEQISVSRRVELSAAICACILIRDDFVPKILSDSGRIENISMGTESEARLLEDLNWLQDRIIPLVGPKLTPDKICQLVILELSDRSEIWQRRTSNAITEYLNFIIKNVYACWTSEHFHLWSGKGDSDFGNQNSIEGFATICNEVAIDPFALARKICADLNNGSCSCHTYVKQDAKAKSQEKCTRDHRLPSTSQLVAIFRLKEFGDLAAWLRKACLGFSITTTFRQSGFASGMLFAHLRTFLMQADTVDFECQKCAVTLSRQCDRKDCPISSHPSAMPLKCIEGRLLLRRLARCQALVKITDSEASSCGYIFPYNETVTNCQKCGQHEFELLFSDYQKVLVWKCNHPDKKQSHYFLPRLCLRPCKGSDIHDTCPSSGCGHSHSQRMSIKWMRDHPLLPPEMLNLSSDLLESSDDEDELIEQNKIENVPPNVAGPQSVSEDTKVKADLRCAFERLLPTFDDWRKVVCTNFSDNCALAVVFLCSFATNGAHGAKPTLEDYEALHSLVATSKDCPPTVSKLKLIWEGETAAEFLKRLKCNLKP